jgi:predicted RNA binding protein YcfA (HicA-like mRNA interferase family)
MRGTHNWTFHEVREFLENNLFEHIHTEGSHYYFKGVVHGEETIVEVPFHGTTPIKQGTLQKSIINKSKIPASEWKKYSSLSSNLRKKYQYEGCVPKNGKGLNTRILRRFLPKAPQVDTDGA